jgi:hypothetical protein
MPKNRTNNRKAERNGHVAYVAIPTISIHCWRKLWLCPIPFDIGSQGATIGVPNSKIDRHMETKLKYWNMAVRPEDQLDL